METDANQQNIVQSKAPGKVSPVLGFCALKEAASSVPQLKQSRPSLGQGSFPSGPR